MAASLRADAPAGTRTIAPTDIAQFIRLEQCQRYLRLRLRERAEGQRFLYDYGVRPQSIPALLTQSGAEFERMVEEAVSRRYWKINFVGDMAHAGKRAHDNERVLHLARNLNPGEVAVLFQPRLLVSIGGWSIRGDVDLLRLERDPDGALHILIADMKASTTAKVEHRLQVTFYVEMLSALFAEAGIDHAGIAMGILYRGPSPSNRTLHESPATSPPIQPAAPPARHLIPSPVGPQLPDGNPAGPRMSADEHGGENRTGELAGEGGPALEVPTEEAASGTDNDDEQEGQRALAEAMFATRDALLELVPDPDNYRASVRDLVTAVDSVAAGVAERDLAELPFHLSYKCDGCLYNEFCLKWTAEHDDLSLLPHITPEEKAALQRAGITTTTQLAHLKTFRNDAEGSQSPGRGRGPYGSNGESDNARAYHSELIAAPGRETLVGKLAATWPVGPHLDELVIRARTYRRWKGEKTLQSLPYIPSKGYGSLPFCSATQNPNLIRIYIDAQHDYLHDRIYMLGALVAASERGEEPPHRRRGIVHLTDGPPDTHEKEEALFLRFVDDLLRAVVELAAPDDDGNPRAPIHLIFFNHFEQRLLLDGLARHFDAILGATPLYDLVTQGAAFDSPIATFLDEEIRELKNYPMVCQSLQAVAAYLRFDWNQPERYREIFRTRMFDFWGKLEGWYFGRARFNSQIPLEYAYAAWGALPPPAKGDGLDGYRGATPELLRGFHGRRLEAIERIAKDFRGNEKTEKRPFDLPDLETFVARAETMAQALDEFVTIERHVALNEWKRIHLLPPERRVLLGETLIARYHDADQEPETAERNRENFSRRALREEYAAAWRAEHPDAPRLNLPKEQRDECAWSQKGMRFRLRIETDGLDCDLDEVLGLSTFRPGDRLIIYERTTVDSRLPKEEQEPMQPTPKQLLYAMRCTLVELTVERDAEGHARAASVEIEMQGGGGRADRGFAFATMNERPLLDGEVYTLDSDPNDWPGSFNAQVTEELAARESTSQGGHNALYDRLVRPAGASGAGPESVQAEWPEAAAAGQAGFLAGLDALRGAGAFHSLEPSKREYIGMHGDKPALLVQGPPGTGKSYSTAFALFARLNGALAARIPFRAILTCKTHAATDVLLQQAVRVREDLRRWQISYPDIFGEYFDARLTEIPFFRVTPRGDVPAGVIPLFKKGESPGAPIALDAIIAERHCIVAATPGGIYRILKDRWNALFDHNDIADCLVLDEASQMNLPEAVVSALPLKPAGQLIVVGDHRQMPPIVKHDWAGERRRTFAAFRSYESLFLALLGTAPPMIKFEESFRLHADMAEFLRREIYHLDGINYHSHQRRLLRLTPAGRAPAEHPDPYVAAVLRPEHTIVVIVHDEAGSLHRNEVEQGLIAPILEALADGAGLGPEHGLGVVVPHRAQRAALQDALPQLSIVDPRTGAVTRSAVDTVERFQGDERNVILVGATESDPQYLLLSSQFLLDPRRLTVALSRAKNKMILVASKSVFSLFSAEEETFANAQLWKNLLRMTCTEQLWSGERDGHEVTVWGNIPQCT